MKIRAISLGLALTMAALVRFEAGFETGSVWGLLTPAEAHASSESAWAQRPSGDQLRRLAHLEPYIRYFTSLAYGPEDARVSAETLQSLDLLAHGVTSGLHEAGHGQCTKLDGRL